MWVWIIIGLIILVVWYKEKKWAFLYKQFGCGHCQTSPCQCARCHQCNHYVGFAITSHSICKNCGWRPEITPPGYHPDVGPAYSGQPVDYTGLGGGGGGYTGV